MITIKAHFSCSIYENDGYCVYSYKKVAGKSFHAVGYGLPTAAGAVTILHGEWERDKKGRTSFKVSSYEVEMPSAEDGTIQFLKSLHIGIGSVLAKRIWNKFGANVWKQLKEDPESLVGISGFTQKKLQALKGKIEELTTIQTIYNTAKDYISSITMAKITPIVEDLGSDAVKIISDNPYVLCRYQGIPFDGIDAMGRAHGLVSAHPDRVAAAITYQLRLVAAQGHMCYPKDTLRDRVLRMLNEGCKPDEVITAEQFDDVVNVLRKNGEKGISVSSSMIYQTSRLEQEKCIATNILRLRNAVPSCGDHSDYEINEMIADYSRTAGVQYADAQLAAIRMAVTNNISIITGGPGTGKTTVIKAVIGIHKKLHENSEPLLLAPTGKAARRMFAQTGYEASTIHSALQLTSGNEEKNDDGRIDHLDANLVIVDEVSMLDSYVAFHLFRCIKDGATVVLVGDSDQLPSVGAGNVLYEVVRSKEVPVIRLNVIFRQANTNPIIPNSAKIREGDTSLIEDGKYFRFYESKDAYHIVQKACSLYVQAVKTRGIDNVILLNPYRDKGFISAKVFNKTLQYHLNPKKDGDKVFLSHGIEFRKGDKIMQMRNTSSAKNGDVGYITDICECPVSADSTELVLCCKVKFNDMTFTYTKKEMKDVDLAYCCTVHKSQGSEHRIVIFVVSHEHENLLRRNLIYTAITRASDTVAIVGERDALNAGILNNTQQRRYSLLGDYLHLYGSKTKKEAI